MAGFSCLSISDWYRRSPRALVSILGFLVACIFIAIQASPRDDPSAPSLRKRLLRSETLWQNAVVQRHALAAHFGDKLDPFPTSSPLPYYTLWNFFTPAYNCPWEVQRVGTIMDGGRWVCGLSRAAVQKNCIVYSIDTSTPSNLGESSFEAEILTNTKCKVYGYDSEGKNWGPEVTQSPHIKPRAYFFPYAIGDKNDHTATPPMWTLRSLMKAHGHKHIAILRIDVEGREFDLLRHIVADYKEAGEPLPFGQVLVEVHALGKSVQTMIEWWEMLEEAGLRAFMTEPNLVFANMARKDVPPGLSEYSFLNVYGNHNLITA